MEQRKILYDNNIRALAKNDTEKRRVLQNQQRQNKRRVLHEIGRNIIVEQNVDSHNDNTNKENEVQETARSRQQKYVERFMAWKKERQLEKETKEKKRRKMNATAIATQQKPETTQPKTADKLRTTNGIKTKLNMQELNDITVQKSQLKKATPKKIDTKIVPKIVLTPTSPINKGPTKLVKCFDACNTAAIKKPLGAVAKVRQMQKNNYQNELIKKRAVNLSVTLKAKKTAATTKTSAAKGVKQFLNKPTLDTKKLKTPLEDVNKKKKNGMKTESKKLILKLPSILHEHDLETPSGIECHTAHFDPCITSTHQKQRNSKTAQIDKFNFEVSIKDRKSQSNNSAKNLAQRFNFVQDNDSLDSDGDDTLTISKKSSKSIEKSHKTENETENSNKVETTVIDENTSRKANKLVRQIAVAEEPPNNFVSSFVSISRGKGSARKEQKKRESMYLNNTFEENSAKTPEIEKSAKVEDNFTVEERRTLEAIRYFRKQLSDEIARLHAQCDIWEQYKVENEAMLEENDCLGMILAAIGQTRLLTSKKLQQFKGLIDRCESHVTGVGDKPCDGSEDTKVITAVDLEGFWGMLGIQFDNLDKCYAKLDRWKSNNWVDPDSIEQKPMEKVKKPQKKKIVNKPPLKSSSSLRDLIRKKQAIKRQLIDPEMINNSIVIVTPSSKRNYQRENSSSPSLRRSILVKDRKQFSIQPTILTVSSPKLKSRLSQASQSNDLLKSTLITAAKEASNTTPVKAMNVEKYSTPIRKSILKTPSTQKSAIRRQVSFCARDYNFIIGSSEDESE